MHTAKYINIDKIIKGYIGEAELTSAQYLRLYQLAVRGVEDLHQDVYGVLKTRVLTVLANKTVELPSDYLQWGKVGVINANGEVATLRHNRNFTKHAATDAARLENIEATDDTGLVNPLEIGFSSSPVYRNFYDNMNNANVNLFGLPAGTQNVGEFKVIDEQGVIILDKNFGPSEIVLEYLASPYEEGKPIMIPIQAQEALLAWIAWRDIINKASSRRVNNGEKVMRKREYYRQRRLARARLKPVRRGEANDTIRLNSNLVLKP